MNRPASKKTNEERERNSSAPRTPAIRMANAPAKTGRPNHEGWAGARASRFRSLQITKIENAGTKKPWEKFGSFHHCSTSRRKMSWYNQAIKITRTAALHHHV